MKILTVGIGTGMQDIFLYDPIPIRKAGWQSTPKGYPATRLT
jgi:hypothetical protein